MHGQLRKWDKSYREHQTGKELVRMSNFIHEKIVLLPVIILLNICIAVSAESEELSLLPDQLPDGFKLTRPVAFYNPGNLFELINGQAVFYLSYGFVKLDHGFYEKDGTVYTVDVYELADRLSALGSYRQQKDDEAEEMNIGCEGNIVDYLAVFYKDKYYIEIIPDDSDDSSIMETMRILAGHIENRIPGTSELPPELELFPHEGLIPGSESYFGENLLSYTFMGHGLSARYMQKQDDKDFRVFISFTNSEKEAQKICEEFEEKLKDPKSEIEHNFPGITISGLSGTLPYRGNAAILTYKHYAFGFLSFTDIEETVMLIGKLVHNFVEFTEK